MKTLRILWVAALVVIATFAQAKTPKKPSKKVSLKHFVQKELKLPIDYNLEKEEIVWVSYRVTSERICKLDFVFGTNEQLNQLVQNHFEETIIEGNLPTGASGMVRITFRKEA